MDRSLRLARLAAILAIAGLAAATAVSFLGRLHWAADLLTHFRVQLAGGAALLAAGAALLRLRAGAAIAGVCLAANALPLAPYVVPRSAEPLTAPPLRVLLLNVLTVNERFDAVGRLIWLEDPDVIGLLEIDDRWSRALAPLRARYPWRIERAQRNNFGIAVLSRVPIERLELRRLEHDAVHVAVGEIAVDGRRAVLLLAHPVPPVGRAATALRDRQIEALARIRSEFPDRDVIVLGDLNTSPWSPSHARLEARAGVANAARGFGSFASWPVGPWWLRAFGVPIDHCLLSPGLRATSIRLGPAVGSDHLPLIVEIAARR